MAFSNSVTLETNFNTDPYFDDFDESKNFHRVLFNPSLGVQARELTQMQSILQNQIDRFGSHIFKEGSIVLGGEFNIDLSHNFIKLRDNNASGNNITVTDFSNTVITGATTGIQALVVNVADGSESDANTKTLFVKYLNGGSNNTTQTFGSGEVITANTGVSANIVSSGTPVGRGAAFTLGESIVYAKDHFVRSPEQTVILSRYSSSPSLRAGYNITETIVTSNEDTSLLDPARNAFNFSAPGADRLKLEVTLATKTLTDTSLSGFNELFQIKDGAVLEKNDRPQYAELRKELARRTYAESGNYVVNGLGVRIREHLNDGTNGGLLTSANGGEANSLSIGVEAGKAFVFGFEYDNNSTRNIKIDKGIDTEEVDQLATSVNYGNFVNVSELSGLWNINEGANVAFFDANTQSVSGQSYSSSTSGGTKIGSGRIKALRYVSGQPGANTGKYRAYLYDIKLAGTKPFSNAKSIFLDNSSDPDAFADIVLEGGQAKLKETSFNRGVFKIPASSVKRLRDSTGNIDNTFKFQKSFDVTISAGGTFTITTGDASETFSGSGALNQTERRDRFILVAAAAGNTGNLTGTVSCSANSSGDPSRITVTGTGTAFSTELNTGDIIKTSDGNQELQVLTINSATSAVVQKTGNITSETTSNFHKVFKSGQVIDLGGVGGDAASRTVTIASSTSATVDIEETLNSGTLNAIAITELNKVNGQEIAKNYQANVFVQFDLSTHPTEENGPWGLGVPDAFKLYQVRKDTSAFTTETQGTDVTSEFELITGQKDNLYDHGKIKLKDNSTLSLTTSDKLLAKFAYFTHNTSSGIGYLSVDSYPINDDDPTDATAITTKEIPLFVSPTSGQSFNLRSCIDIRPIVANTCNPSTTVSAAPSNPANSDIGTGSAFVVPSGGLHTIVPNESFTTDLEFFLPRKDLVTLDSQGKYKVVRGVSSLTPKTPRQPEDSIVLARVNVSPFPSISPAVGRSINRSDLSSSIKQIDNRRFTMRDIGTLKQRIDNLEYYVSLSLLEKETAEKQVTDSNGLDRFKNGILVDPFTGHNIGDVFNPDYKIAIDPVKQEARPLAEINQLELEVFANTTTNLYRSANDATVTVASGTYTNGENVFQGSTLGSSTARGVLRYQVDTKLYLENVQGSFANATTTKGDSSSASATSTSVVNSVDTDILTLPYSHKVYANQAYASTTRNAAGLFYLWQGSVNMDPETDTWFDTVQRPDVQINFDNNQDNFENIDDAFNTIWDSWQRNWSGIEENQVGQQNDTQSGSRTTGTVLLEDFGAESALLSSQRRTVTGIRSRNLPESRTQEISARTVDTTIVPFMRSRDIRFTGVGLKPETKLFAFFDNEDVSEYITPTNSSFANTANEGGSLVSNADGNVHGIFRIPNDDTIRFRIGTKNFKLTDSPTDAKTEGNFTTFGIGQFTSYGVLDTVQDIEIVSTRPAPEPRPEPPTQQRSGTRVIRNNLEEILEDVGPDGGGDPIAQSFYVRPTKNLTTGVFLTKIDVFFAEKDATLPVTLEVRQVKNGVVTQKRVPLSRVTLPSSEVNTSTDGSSPTPFVFESPIFLTSDVEYAFVIIPSGPNPNYKVWVSKLGENDLVSGNRITEQPFSGVLYASSNDRSYVPIQDEDMKFVIYQAEFDTTATGTLDVRNEDMDFLTLENISGGFTIGDEVVRTQYDLTVSSAAGSNSVIVGQTIEGGTSGAVGNIVRLNGDHGAQTVSSVTSVTVTSKKIFTNNETIFFRPSATVGGSGTITGVGSFGEGKVRYYNPNNNANTLFVANTTGTFTANDQIIGVKTGNTATIQTINNLELHTLNIQAQQLVFSNNSIQWQVKTTGTGGSLDSTFTNIDINDNNDLTAEKIVESRQNEGGSKSLQAQATLTSDDPNLSPIIDIERLNAVIVANKINNLTTNEANTAADHASSVTGNGGSALSKYITRKVTLEDDQDAEDMRVFLTAYKPSGSEISVFYRILNSSDDTLFNDRAWVQMEQTTTSTIVSDTKDTNDFKEFQYDIPSTHKDGDGVVQYTNNGVIFERYKNFAVKIVVTSSDKTIVPRFKELRVIALQA